MHYLDFVRIAVDNNIICWKAFQGQQLAIKTNDPKSRDKLCDYEAVQRLFELQKYGRVVLVAVDQVYREASKTSDKSKRMRLLYTVYLCKEKFFLTRFDTLSHSHRALKASGESGINLSSEYYWVTDDNKRRIKEYVEHGRTPKEKVDLEVLATIAIAGVRRFVTVDEALLANSHIIEFVKQQDDIWIYRPSEILPLVDITPQQPMDYSISR
jgi:hypothetical protein